MKRWSNGRRYDAQRRFRRSHGASRKRRRRQAVGLGRHLTDALEARRRSEIDREIARLLAQSRGRLTDSMEREIMQKVFASDWSLPQ